MNEQLIKLGWAYGAFAAIAVLLMGAVLYAHYINANPKRVRVVFTNDLFFIQHKLWCCWVYTTYPGGEKLHYASREQAIEKVDWLLKVNKFKVIAEFKAGESVEL